ncbi:hypothetical protein [Methylobacterium sp. P5_C11]
MSRPRKRKPTRTTRVPHAPVLPESLTRLTTEPVPEPGWIAAPLRDIAAALLAGVIVALIGGQILLAW